MARISFRSVFAMAPCFVKNFMPFRLKGRWLAVSMMAPSKSLSGRTVDWNMAGVVMRPQSKLRTVERPYRQASFICSAVTRLSWPTPTLMKGLGRPVVFSRYMAKARAM